MSVRVIARLRPLLDGELEKDIIVRADSAARFSGGSRSTNLVRIPNPKNPDEDFTFQFNDVYDTEATQEEIFQGEIAPSIQHLFEGFDVTLFAYGSTGAGKTHTMRGGKSLAERGVIPRLLSGVYRKGRKMEKDSEGATTVQVSMSYYEIYNDRVFDLFQPPEKRTPTGLVLREQHGKTVVVGLTERPCSCLKDFERLYDQANINRSTSATKLNAHSSRSHAILRVKVSIMTDDKTRISTASAIDLAGSEDNRRTENGKERLVESASINKSLFVLAQCVEAITKKQSRIPYRESKLTRILSLGQNNGLTVMILNLAPIKSFHLDTLSSLNVANRTKKIEVKDIENQPIFKGQKPASKTISAAPVSRRPLQSLTNHDDHMARNAGPVKKLERPRKAFAVYSDRSITDESHPPLALSPAALSHKRKADSSLMSRPAKALRQTREAERRPTEPATVSKEEIEEIVERKVEEALAARAMNDTGKDVPVEAIGDHVRRRLDVLEHRIQRKEGSKSEGLTFLLMAKQHHVRGEDASALKMYQLALPHFPDNKKLTSKMHALQERIRGKAESLELGGPGEGLGPRASVISSNPHISVNLQRGPCFDQNLPSPHRTSQGNGGAHRILSSRESQFTGQPLTSCSQAISSALDEDGHTPRTRRVLEIINTCDVAQIKLLRGVGIKKAESMVASIDAMMLAGHQQSDDVRITSLEQLARLKGVGVKTVANMRLGMT